jgi:hypothetical protein
MRIDDANRKPGDPVEVFHNQGEAWLKMSVWDRVYMPNQCPIFIDMRGVAAP